MDGKSLWDAGFDERHCDFLDPYSLVMNRRLSVLGLALGLSTKLFWLHYLGLGGSEVISKSE